MSTTNTVRLASQLLGIDVSTLINYATELDELLSLHATYYSVPEKGGASLIVSDSGEVLYASSSIGVEDHIAAFKQGIRTPLEDFVD
jgi:hypothetical protein